MSALVRPSTLCAAALATAAALPAVWWEPLHLDERVTLEYARLRPWEIIREIFVERGGAPLHFLVERVTLTWPDGLEGLRLPSLLFLVLALVWVAPVADRLAGEWEARTVPFLLAAAPLAVGLATFARMYTLFLWLVLVAAWLSLRAGSSASRHDWIAAGAVAGGLVYVHPIAPLYVLPVLACGLATSKDRPAQVLRAAAPGILAAGLVALPYAYALAVLRSRYGVGEGGLLATTAGRTVPEESLHALTPAGSIGLAAFSVVALAGGFRLARERPRSAAVLTVWLALPIAFFTLVPAETRFFGRYLLPALPALLVLVATGCRSLGRRGGFALALLVALVGLELGEDAGRLRDLRELDLRSLPTPAAGQVLFSSTGSPRSDRPPELLDDLVALEARDVHRVEELPAIDPRYETGLVMKGAHNLRSFLAEDGSEPGLWLFRGRPRRVEAAVRRLAREPGVATRRIGSELLVVSSPRAWSRRRLVELAVRVRVAWGLDAPADRWPRTIAAVDRAALAYRGRNP